MSFKTAVKFLDAYRTNRMKALNNEVVMGWSTQPVADLQAMVDVFDSEEVNEAWTVQYNALTGEGGAGTPSLMQGLRLEINFLGGCRRDVRMQYAAGPTSRTRVGADYNRFEYSRLAYGNYVMDLTDKMMDLRLKA